MFKKLLLAIMIVTTTGLMGMSDQEILEGMFPNKLNHYIELYSNVDIFAKDSFTRSLVETDTPLFRLIDKKMRKIGKDYSINNLNELLTALATKKLVLGLSPSSIVEYDGGDFNEYRALLMDKLKKKIFYEKYNSSYSYGVVIAYLMNMEFLEVMKPIDYSFYVFITDSEKKKAIFNKNVDTEIGSIYKNNGWTIEKDIVIAKRKIYQDAKIEPASLVDWVTGDNNPYADMKTVKDEWNWTPADRAKYEIESAKNFVDLKPGDIFLKDNGDGRSVGRHWYTLGFELGWFWNHATMVRTYQEFTKYDDILNKLNRNPWDDKTYSKTEFAHQKLYISSWPGSWFDSGYSNNGDINSDKGRPGWEKRFMWQYLDEFHCYNTSSNNPELLASQGVPECDILAQLPLREPNKYIPMGKRIRRLFPEDKVWEKGFRDGSTLNYRTAGVNAAKLAEDLIGDIEWLAATCSAFVAYCWHLGGGIRMDDNAAIANILSPDDINDELEQYHYWDWYRGDIKNEIFEYTKELKRCSLKNSIDDTYLNVTYAFDNECGDWKRPEILDRTSVDSDRDEICLDYLDKMYNRCGRTDAEDAETRNLHNTLGCSPGLSIENLEKLKECLDNPSLDCLSVTSDHCPNLIKRTMGEECSDNMYAVLIEDQDTSTEEIDSFLTIYQDCLNNQISSTKCDNAIYSISKCYGWFDRKIQHLNKKNYQVATMINGELIYSMENNTEICIKLFTLNETHCKSGDFNEEDREVNYGLDHFYCRVGDLSDLDYFDQEFYDDAEQLLLYTGIHSYVIQDSLITICDIHDNLY